MWTKSYRPDCAKPVRPILTSPWAVVASTSSPASQNMDAALEEATKWQIEWNTRRCKLGLYLVQTGDESGVALLESVYAEPRYVDPDARAAARDALQARGRLP